jgi:hypothetical protein
MKVAYAYRETGNGDRGKVAIESVWRFEHMSTSAA